MAALDSSAGMLSTTGFSADFDSRSFSNLCSTPFSTISVCSELGSVCSGVSSSLSLSDSDSKKQISVAEHYSNMNLLLDRVPPQRKWSESRSLTDKIARLAPSLLASTLIARAQVRRKLPVLWKLLSELSPERVQ